MTNYADTGSCYGGRVMGLPPSNYGVSLPRSFSTTSSRSNDSEDFRELLRAASTRTLAESRSTSSSSSSDLSLYIQQEMMLRRKQPPRGAAFAGGLQKKMPPRSCSVGMGRIDEDKPCCAFAEEEEEEEADYRQNRNQKLVYPRSKSYAVNNSSKSLAF